MIVAMPVASVSTGLPRRPLIDTKILAFRTLQWQDTMSTAVAICRISRRFPRTLHVRAGVAAQFIPVIKWGQDRGLLRASGISPKPQILHCDHLGRVSAPYALLKTGSPPPGCSRSCFLIRNLTSRRPARTRSYLRWTVGPDSETDAGARELNQVRPPWLTGPRIRTMCEPLQMK